MLPILYSFRRCPYAIRARMALYYSGVRCELREVILQNKPEPMLEASPKGTVPVLITGSKVIAESLEVMQWALSQADLHHWLIDSFEHPLLERNDSYFKYWLDRYKYCDRFPEADQQAYFVKAVVFLQELETCMMQDSVGAFFIGSPQVSLLDVSIFPFVRQLAFVDKARFDNLIVPKLHKWLHYWLSAPLFLSVMEKYPAWSEQSEAVVYFGLVE